MFDALKVVEESGYNVSKLTPNSEGYDFVYDMAINRFALVKGTTLIAGPSDK